MTAPMDETAAPLERALEQLFGGAGERRRAPVTDPRDACWDRLDGHGRLVIDGGGRLLWMNVVAECLIERRRGVTLAGGALRLTDPRAQERLQRALASPSDAPVTILSQERGRGVAEECGDWMLVRLVAILSGPGLATRFAVVLRAIGLEEEPEWACLDEAFGLTSAETRVLERLLDGGQPAEIADALGLSVHTVRTHVAHVYAKAGVSSRAELWKRCAPFRIANRPIAEKSGASSK